MKTLFTISCFFLTVGTVFAQTATEKRLEAAVKIYNSLRDSVDTFKASTLTDEQIVYTESMRDAGVRIFDSLIRVLPEGNEERRVSRYFRANLEYQVGFVYGMKGRNEDAFKVFDKIEPDFDYFGNTSVFPLRYKFDGKNYSVKYENFVGSYIEFYTGFGEVCANTSRSDRSLYCSRKTLSMTENSTDYLWYRYIAITKIIEQKKKKNEFDTEMLDMAYKLAYTYNILDTSYRKTIKDNNYPTIKTSYNRINDVFEKKPELIGNGEMYAKTAPLFAKEKDYVKAEDFYTKALKYNYSFSKSELEQIIDVADKRSNNKLGIDAATRYEKLLSSTDCDGYRKLAGYYKLFDDKTREDAALVNVRKCENLVAEQRKNEERRKRRVNRGFMVYTATYPLALATRFGDYRDYGLVFGLGTNRMQIEFSGKLINRNFVLQEDLAIRSIDDGGVTAYWSGRRMHVALRFNNGKSSNDNFFMGPVFELVQRNFEPIWCNVNTSSGQFVASEMRFEAKETAYTAYFNFGTYFAKKFIYFEYFTGLGVYWANFDSGAGQYSGDAYMLSAPILESRKESRFGPAIRMGVTLGFCTRK
ncbi:MAG: hypothetical protein ACRC3B_19055 [Bacteroidia bacterium]